MLGDCSYARSFWATFNLPHSLIFIDVQCVWDWISRVRQVCSVADYEFFLCACWSIWSNRNKVVHEQVGFDPLESNMFALNYLANYEEAHKLFSQPSSTATDLRWKPPDDDYIKLNFDDFVQRIPSRAIV